MLNEQWENYRRRRVINLLIYITVELIAYTLVALYLAVGVSTESSYRTSWIGNTFGSGSKWVQNSIYAMYVATDGTVYTNSEWDEGGREAGIYRDGDVVGALSQLHGWGRTGGGAVTANSKYVYIAMKQKPPDKMVLQDYPSSGTNWYAVRRYNLSGSPAPFSGGRGYDGSMLIVSTSGSATGLANAGSELYVSDSAANRIRVYNTETMRELRNWAFTRPGHIAVDGQGNLWIIQAKDASHAPKILYYSKTGTLLAQQITDVIEPTALAVDNQGRLLVAENGLRQHVLIYNITETPTLVGTFGAKGGIYSGTQGEVGDMKFYGLTGVGTDAAGNIYVSSNGFKPADSGVSSGNDLRKFSPSGAQQWRLLGLQFLDNADADPSTDGVEVFTKNERFLMDYSKDNGKEWIYKAYTLDKFRYPDDARLYITHTSPFIRRIGGKRFMYLTTQMSERLSIYRFDGEIAVPCGMFGRSHLDWPTTQPAKSRWVWRDLNGDGSIQSNEYEILGPEDDSIWGWEVDSKGDIWQASESGFIRHYSFRGLDAHSSPIYSSAASEEIPMPAPFNKLGRIKYFPETDVMYLGGYTVEHPQIGKEWGIVGTEILRYDNWSKRKNVRWRVTLPYAPDSDPMLIIKAMDVAGDRVFAVDSRKAEVYVYDGATGAFVMKLTFGPKADSDSWIDFPYGLRAYRRSNGEYLVFVEEVTKGKVIMYRLADIE